MPATERIGGIDYDLDPDDTRRHNETGYEWEDEIDVDWEIGRRLGK